MFQKQDPDTGDVQWEILFPTSSNEALSEQEARIPVKPIYPHQIRLHKGEPIDYSLDDRLGPYVNYRWAKFVWEKVNSGMPRPTPGPLVRLSKMPSIDASKMIDLHLAQTDYREHIATMFPEAKYPEKDYASNLPLELVANVLNSIAVLVTVDNHLIYSVRGKTASFDGTFSGYGTVIHSPEEVFEGGGSQYLFDQVKGAVFNETGMAQTENAEDLEQGLRVELGGFAYIHGMPDKGKWIQGFNIPLWVAYTKLEKGYVDEIFAQFNDKRIRDSPELKYPGIGSVPLQPEAYHEFLKHPQLVPTVKPIWAYLGIMRFGDEIIPKEF
ncbi:MAG: hypothetical protein ABII01_02315 [Candidatus Woesearchaeota archaeon]